MHSNSTFLVGWGLGGWGANKWLTVSYTQVVFCLQIKLELCQCFGRSGQSGKDWGTGTWGTRCLQNLLWGKHLVMFASQKSSARSDPYKGLGRRAASAQDDFIVETETNSSLSGKKLFSCIKSLKSDEKVNRFILPGISHLGLHQTQTD